LRQRGTRQDNERGDIIIEGQAADSHGPVMPVQALRTAVPRRYRFDPGAPPDCGSRAAWPVATIANQRGHEGQRPSA
jgi:hypothetical protein